jgi:lipoprotein-anchoring transpeptidase ErfK/SrfK
MGGCEIMRWSLYVGAFFMILLLAGGGYGWVKYKAAKKQQAVNDEAARCKTWIDLNQHDKAQEGLVRLLNENPKMRDADVLLTKLAGSYEATSATEKAAKCWQTVCDQYPDSGYVPKALSALADYALAKDDPAKASENWNQILTKYDQSDVVDDAKFGLAQLEYKESGDRVKMRQTLWDLLEAYPTSDKRPKMEALLGDINVSLLFSPQEVAGNEEFQIHVIKKGDALDSLRKTYKVSPELLMRVNGIRNPKMLSIGKQLVIPQTDFSIEVDKASLTLQLLNRGKFFKRYSIRMPREELRVPGGVYSIERKVENPTWTADRTYPSGDPGNILGTRMMSLKGSNASIHGTNDPSTIGQYASAGYIGMTNQDVEELYDLAPKGAKVEIKGKIKKDDKAKK